MKNSKHINLGWMQGGAFFFGNGTYFLGKCKQDAGKCKQDTEKCKLSEEWEIHKRVIINAEL